MIAYFTPNMPECIGKSDSESINNSILYAKKNGENTVVIPSLNERTNENLWVIDKAILLPSDIHIILENSHLRQADGCFDNVFRNENMYSEGSSTTEKEQHNIYISGIGNAIIDGGNHNGLTELNSGKDGFPYISCNNMILLHNVHSFGIENITFKDQRWWAINLLYAYGGKLKDITFDAKDNVPNQDGIDLRAGCHDILIENVYGQAGDDLIALSGFLGELEQGLVVNDKSSDIFNVTIRNVKGTSVTKAIVALRNHDGIKLHDITVDGVTDTSADEKGNSPYAVVRIGQKTYANIRHSLPGETSRIFINNVHANHGDAILVNVTLTDSRIDRVYCGKDARTIFSTRTDWIGVSPGAYMENVTIEGIRWDSERSSDLPLIELIKGDYTDGMKNVSFKKQMPKDEKLAIYSEYTEGYTVS